MSCDMLNKYLCFKVKMVKSSTCNINLNSDEFYRLEGERYVPSSVFVSLKITQFLWMILNYFRLLRGSNFIKPRISSLNIKHFQLSSASVDWDCSSKQSSPSRFVCDLFWANQDWGAICKDLGQPISALDIGCGTGLYLEKLLGYGAKFESYNGFDAQKNENWNCLESKYPFSSFTQASTAEIGSILNKFQPNFVFSQSCLEHIANDKGVVNAISEYAASNKKRVVQFHLVPSQHCLWLYGLHGIRIYTIAMIESFFSPLDQEKTSIDVYELGGEECFKVHQKFINDCDLRGSKGVDIRKDNSTEYWHSLKEAISVDLAGSTNSRPSFYAIKIFHDI